MRLEDRKRSARLFEEGFAAFVSSRFMNIHEYRRDKFPDQPVAGPFIANLAGFLVGSTCGLTGMRIGPGDPSGWCERPVVLPEGWDAIEIDRLWVRGKPARLIARHGADRLVSR